MGRGKEGRIIREGLGKDRESVKIGKYRIDLKVYVGKFE